MKEKENLGAVYVLHTLFPLLFLMQLLLCKLAVESFKHVYFDLIIQCTSNSSGTNAISTCLILKMRD